MNKLIKRLFNKINKKIVALLTLLKKVNKAFVKKLNKYKIKTIESYRISSYMGSDYPRIEYLNNLSKAQHSIYFNAELSPGPSSG